MSKHRNWQPAEVPPPEVVARRAAELDRKLYFEPHAMDRLADLIIGQTHQRTEVTHERTESTPHRRVHRRAY